MATLDDFLPDISGVNANGALEVLRLSDSPVVFTVFTSQIGELITHYVDLPNLRAEVRCNTAIESRCLLCDLKHKRTNRAILPVADVSTNDVKVVLMSDARSPYSLAPQIKSELRRGGLDKRFLTITRNGHKFVVESIVAKPGQDMCELAIDQFNNNMTSGLVALESAIPIYPNSELWDVPELERKAEAMGLVRSDYVNGGATLAVSTL
jgi:hypothetical protein